MNAYSKIITSQIDALQTIAQNGINNTITSAIQNASQITLEEVDSKIKAGQNALIVKLNNSINPTPGITQF